MISKSLHKLKGYHTLDGLSLNENLPLGCFLDAGQGRGKVFLVKRIHKDALKGDHVVVECQ